MATRSKARKAAPGKTHSTPRLSRNEEKLVRLFRNIESEHERDAILVLTASIANGRLSKAADKIPARSLVRGL